MLKFVESAIATLSPRWAANRAAYRYETAKIQAASGQHESMNQLLGTRFGGYEAGKGDRLKGRVIGSPHENDIPRQQISALRYRSWNLYRNCPQARKICRTLGAKVIGSGLSPQPQATTKDGKPFVEFRRRAREVFDEFTKECDFRGKPGSGGHNFESLCKTALRASILSGGALYRFKYLSAKEQRKLNLFVPLQVQLLHIDRLDSTRHGGNEFYGLKLDDDGRVMGFWVLRGGVDRTIPQATADTTLQQAGDSVYVPIEEMRHLSFEEDIDQLLGAPWMGAAMLTMDDRRNYEYSELIAAEAASCIVGKYRRAAGQTGGPGLATETGPLTDADGNAITRLQPMMFLDLGTNGEFNIETSTRPNNAAGEFLSHLIRTEAVGVAGVKASTLTGDYRNSSFSSERSADNDVWPEIQELQDWFSTGFCQPIYEAVISAAVLAGLFDDVPGFTATDFQLRKRNYLNTHWQGPVALSINPKDDAEAARERNKNGTSSPQRECGKIGVDHEEILREQKEHMDKCKELGLPDDIWQQNLGIEQIDQPDQPDQAAAKPVKPAKANDRLSEQQQDALYHRNSFLMNSAT